MRFRLMLPLLAAGSGILLAQSAPIKMGLWERTMVTTGHAGPVTLKAKSCITPSTWEKMLLDNTLKQHQGCTMNNLKTPNGYTSSGSCTIPNGSMVLKASATMQDSEHIVSEFHTTTTIDGKVRESESHSISHFVAASCGTVKPGEPAIEDN
jgi:hypothetical protein